MQKNSALKTISKFRKSVNKGYEKSVKIQAAVILFTVIALIATIVLCMRYIVIAPIKIVIASLSEGIGNINSGSDQISTGGQKLAKDTAEQAAILPCQCSPHHSSRCVQEEWTVVPDLSETALLHYYYYGYTNA